MGILFRMNTELTIFALTLYRRSCEAIYKIVHTKAYVLEEPLFSFKLPVATLRSNLMVLER